MRKHKTSRDKQLKKIEEAVFDAEELENNSYHDHEDHQWLLGFLLSKPRKTHKGK
jgi:hypothetical protein